jgi:endonuclease-3 related protein
VSIIGFVPEVASIYDRLLSTQGHSGWWPGETAFEVCLGAILTQNTAWTNAEKALRALEGAGVLSYEALRTVPDDRLAELLRPSGTYRVKTARVRAFLDFLGREYGGRVEAMAADPPRVLRRKLLAVSGIGPETADAIALYAAGQPLFVVDAYTRRVFGRLGLLRGGETYDEVQALFMEALPADVPLYRDFHAQIVRLAKDVCRKTPRCGGCALEAVCVRGGLE